MQNINLPPGCLLRKAKQQDIWKILFLPISFSGQDRNLRFWVTFLWKSSYIVLTLIVLLVLISLFSYFLSHRLGEYLLGYLMSQSLVPDTWQVKLAFLLYGNPTGFGANIGEKPNLLGSIISFVVTFILFSPLIVVVLRQITVNTWVVECNHHIVATGKLLLSPQRIILINLYVNPAYRHQGIGSGLVTYIKQQFQQPIYLACIPELVPYYTRLGFIRVPTSDRLFSLTTNGELVAMVTDNAVTTSSTIQNTTNTPFDLLVNDCVIRPAQARDINSIRSFIFFNSPKVDFYLPFGINFSIVSSSLNLLLLLNGLFILSFHIIAIISPIKLPLFFLKLILELTVAIIFVFIFIAFMGNIFILQKIPRLLLLEYRHKLIGYARISHEARYSILYYLCINIRYKQDYEAYFLQQILHTTKKPILVACNSHNVKLYSDLGFMPISLENLPKKLRLGARINLQLGGMNLVHPNNQEIS